MDGFQHAITALVVCACILAGGVVLVVLWPFIVLIGAFLGAIVF